MAVGNSLGAGSLSLEAGVVKNVDATMWEVSTDIIPGNSGGPMLDLKSGKVTGIVTHLIMKRGRRIPGVGTELNVKRFRRADSTANGNGSACPCRASSRSGSTSRRWTPTATSPGRPPSPSSVITNSQGINSPARHHAIWRQQMAHASNVMKENGGHFSVQRTKQWMDDYRGNYQSRDAVQKAQNVMDNNLNSIRINGKEAKPNHFSWFHREAYKEVLAMRKELSDRAKKDR